MILSNKWVPSSSEKGSTRSLSAKGWRVESKAMGLKTLGFFVFLWGFIKRITEKKTAWLMSPVARNFEASALESYSTAVRWEVVHS